MVQDLIGYSHPGTYLDYSGTNNYEDVVQEIDDGRPVLFRGGRKDNWFIFPVYKDGHAWVCDGFKKSKICHENGATSYLFFHMNWGWDNLLESGRYEGWYGFLDFTPGNNTFNYKSGVIINICP